MSWSVNNIMEMVRYLTNKYQSGYVTPNDLFYAWNSEQRMYMSDLLGRFQVRNNGKTAANTGLLENETILTKLTPFTKSFTLPVTAGQALKPTDFIYGLAARVNEYEVYMINKGQIQSVTNSVIDPPSTSDNAYYATEYQNYYKVLPMSVSSMDVDYISDTNDIVWGSIPDANGLLVYDPGSSVQPLWDSISTVEITKRTLRTLGIHFSSQDFENNGASTQNTGN